MGGVVAAGWGGPWVMRVKKLASAAVTLHQ